MIAIIDYGAGNLRSVKKALDYIGAAAEITGDARKIEAAGGVILPGVGAFGDAMECMRQRGLEQVVRRAADGARPFLGICLGLQLLFGSSQESPGATGLGVVEGTVTRIPEKAMIGNSEAALKVPHMGWNSISLRQRGGLFAGVPDGSYVYFVHSYCVHATDPEQSAARTEYGLAFDAAVSNGLMTATQFHPEKSGEVGLHMLRNFAGML